MSSTVITSHRDQLLNDAPTIDTALKSFASWWMASHSSSSPSPNEVWTLQDVLAVSRLLSQSINAHVCSLSASTTSMRNAPTNATDSPTPAEVTAQVWNELVGMKHKPTKVLGQTSLRQVWSDIDMSRLSSTDEKGKSFLDAFERLLFAGQKADNNPQDQSDAKLIWDGDRGEAELARRSTDRQERAAERRQQIAANETKSPTIEELPDDTPID